MRKKDVLEISLQKLESPKHLTKKNKLVSRITTT